jgi:hypothetical protein
LKHTDEHIRKVFSDKLREMEVEVPDALWNAVSQKLPSAVSGGTTWLSVATKWIAAALLSATAAGLVIWKLSDDKDVNSDLKSSEQTELVSNQGTESAEIDTEVLAREPEPTIMQDDRATIVTTEKSLLNPVDASDPRASADQGQPIQAESFADVKQKLDDHHNVSRQSIQESNNNVINAASNDVGQQTPATAIHDQPSISVVAIDKDTRQYFFMASVTDARSYSWEFGDGGYSTEMSPAHQFDEDGEYEIHLSILEPGGRKIALKHDLIIATPGKLDIPKNIIITPNGDGLNDRFDVTAYAEGIVFSRIQIRNQAGEVVFESDGQTMWDGTDPSGSSSPTGYYQFLVRGTDRNQDLREKRGVVYLSR